MSVDQVIEAVENKVETVAGVVATEAKAEVAKVEEKVKEAVIQLKAEEKLFLADTELEFLKIQTEIQRLTKLAEDKSKGYQAYVEGLFKTYGVTKAEYLIQRAVRVQKPN